MKSPSPFWMKVAVGFFVLVLVLVGLRMLLWWKVHQEIYALRERGIATTAAEFIAQLPQIPDEQNAAVQFLKAYNNIRFEPVSLFRDRNITSKISDEFNYFKTPSPSPEVLEKVGEFLALNEKQFADMHKALQLPESLFPVDYSKGLLHANFSPLMQIRVAVNTLKMRSAYYAVKENPKKTFESLMDNLRFDSLYRNEKPLISHLIRIAINSISLSSLLDATQRIEFGHDELMQLQAQLASMSLTNFSAKTIEAELSGLCDFYLSQQSFADLAFIGSLSTPSSPPSIRLPKEWASYYTKKGLQHLLEWLIRITGLWDLNFLKTVEIYNQLIEASRLPYPEQFNEFQKIEDQTQKLSVFCPMPKMVIPAVSKSATRYQIDAAQICTAETALAVERYRLKHKKLPDSLGQIAPEFIESIPLDPFDGKPLKYRKDGASFYVYSIGDNLTDDGGDPAKSKSGTKAIYGEDIVFFIERP